MNKFEVVIAYKQSQKIKRFATLFLCTFAFLGIGFKEGNVLLLLMGLIPASIICFLIYLNYKKDVEFTECLKELRQRKVTVQKSLRLEDGEILLLNKDGDIPKNGFKNLICVNLSRNKIYWIASLISEVHEKYNDFAIVDNSIEAVTSNNYLATINLDNGEVIHSRLKR